MEFRTKTEVEPSSRKINYDSNVFLTGSCFSKEIGYHFARGKMNTMINPFGVLYNPLSVGQSIEKILDGKEFTVDELIRYNNRYISLAHDTSFSSDNPEDILNKVNESLSEARNFILRADFLFLTFGTARIFKWKDDGRVVANCHKIPSDRFERILLDKNEIIGYWKRITERIRENNKNVEMVFTVSPVRHLKDGAHGNQVSKAVLLTAINELIEQDNSLGYFPSYEIILDELRDYRFYKNDMIHPSELAVEYVWERLKDCYFDDAARNFYDSAISISNARKHRIMNDDRKAIEKFKETILQKIQMLKNKYPGIDLSEDESYFKTL